MKTQVRLYEIKAIVTYSTVVAATSEEDAMKHVESWEDTWSVAECTDLIGVSDVELFDVRDLQSVETLDDEAHEITQAAREHLELISPPEEDQA